MAQTAINGWVALPADTWTQISEINCTFVIVQGTSVELLGMDGAAPGVDDRGIKYPAGQGEDAATASLERFTGAGTANRLYLISRGETGIAFVSRAEVA